MALTKAQTVVEDWNAVAQNVTEESGELDCSDSYDTGLTIQAALDTVTAHTGTEFIVFVTVAGADDEDWAILPGGRFVDLIGTASTENLTNNPLAAGGSSLTMADTAGFETYGAGIDEIPGWRLIKNSSLANSELIFQTSFAADASIAWVGVNKNSHIQNTPLYNIAISKLVQIPFWVGRAKVIVNNTYDIDGSSLNYRILGGKVTALT
jgi:hypothetical protein